MKWSEFESELLFTREVRRSTENARKLAEFEARQSKIKEIPITIQDTLVRLKVRQILEVLKEEYWHEGVVQPLTRRIPGMIDGGYFLVGYELVSDNFITASVQNEFKSVFNVSARLVKEKTSISVQINPNIYEEKASIYISDHRMFDTEGGDYWNKKLREEIKINGFGRAFRDGPWIKFRSDKFTSIDLDKKDHEYDFKEAIYLHNATRMTLGAYPNQIREWSHRTLSLLPVELLPTRHENATKEQFRAWAHDMRGSSIIRRLADRALNPLGISLV